MVGQRAFMLELHKAVDAEVKAGKKLDDIVKTENGKQITTIQLPDSVKKWVGTRAYRASERYIQRDHVGQTDRRLTALID